MIRYVLHSIDGKRQFSRINDNYDGPPVKEQIKLYWGEKIKKLFLLFSRSFLGERQQNFTFSRLLKREGKNKVLFSLPEKMADQEK